MKELLFCHIADFLYFSTYVFKFCLFIRLSYGLFF